MDSLANKLHSIFIFTSFLGLYLVWFDMDVFNTSMNQYAYIILFLQLVMIIRYFNPKMLEKKELQVKIISKVGRLFLIIFIFNWIFISFGFAFLFTIVFLLNNTFYKVILNQINKQKEQEEFKKQFGDGNFSKTDIVNKHILNLFETNLDENQLTKSDIKKQYRLMAKKYHPDVYKGDEIDKFSSINLSYQYLIDLIK